MGMGMGMGMGVEMGVGMGIFVDPGLGVETMAPGYVGLVDLPIVPPYCRSLGEALRCNGSEIRTTGEAVSAGVHTPMPLPEILTPSTTVRTVHQSPPTASLWVPGQGRGALCSVPEVRLFSNDARNAVSMI